MANPFTCKLLHKEASFASVSDERNQHLFTRRELGAIRHHIPWTRVVAERFSMESQERSIDLIPWILHNREKLVIKPNDDYGDTGVIIGWEVGDSEWEQAVMVALQEPSIVQEQVEISYEEFPFVDAKGGICVGRCLVDCDPFLFHGDMVGGCLVRLSNLTLLNVTAGGSIIPAFIVDEL